MRELFATLPDDPPPSPPGYLDTVLIRGRRSVRRRRLGTASVWLVVLLVLAVLNLGPWRETLAFGQINILLMGLMAADLLARNPRWTRGFPGSGFLVGVAAGEVHQ